LLIEDNCYIIVSLTLKPITQFMKKLSLLVALLGISYLSISQTVENIRVQPEDDKIRITYRIGGSTQFQTYNVELTCSMDGGPRFEPRSVEGDVGENITGGKSIYMVIWDVFEDVDEVGYAEFFVKVDMVSDMSPRATPLQTQPETQPETQPSRVDRADDGPAYPDFDEIETRQEEIDWRGYLAYTGSTQSLVGLSFGTLKNVGGYGGFRFGNYNTDWDTNFWVTFLAGLTKYVFHSGKYRLHGYAGAGVLVEYYEEFVYYNSWTDTYLAIDMGIINVFGRLSLSVGLEWVNYADDTYARLYPTFGLGVAF
jgi:hypothetical protein